MSTVLLALLAAAAQVGAHICILEPPQRGNLSVTTPGDPSCYRRTNYCGGIPVPKAPATTLVAGSTSVIKFQQNLNHWHTPKPGYLDLAIAYKRDPTEEADFKPLYLLNDYAGFEMVQSTTFDVAITIPDIPCDHCILRARYVSYNPMEVDPKDNTDAIFYNCADIAIVQKATRSAVEPPEPLPTRTAATTTARPLPAEANGASDVNASCVTPNKWRASFLEENAWGWVEHSIWWDASRNLSRWDKNGSIDASGISFLSLISNYTAPLEYVNFVRPAGKCHIYGNDFAYPWAYGAASGMEHVGRTASGGVDFWQGRTVSAGDRTVSAADRTALPIQNAYQYRWQTKSLGGGLCSPLGWQRGEASVQLTEFEVDPDFGKQSFVPQPECLKKPAFSGCRPEAARAAWEALHGARVD